MVDRIAATKTDRADRPLDEQKMVKVTVETFGQEYAEPEHAKARRFPFF